MRKRWWAAIMIVGAVGLTAAGVFGWKAWRAEWARRHPEEARIARYEQVFDAAWKTVDEKYYDPNFDHARWRKVRDVYRPHVKEASNDAIFYINILSNMLGRVGSSHVNIVMPPREPIRTAPVKAGAVPVLTPKLGGCGGRDLEITYGFDLAEVRRGHTVRSLVANLRKGSSAERVGLEPNSQVRKMTLAWRKDGCPHATMQVIPTGGPPRDIAFDVEDLPVRPRVQRVDLPSGIRVLRFNHFDRDAEAWLAQNLAPAPRAGLILDLRQNGGGKIWVEKRVLSRFLPPGTLVGRQVTRGRTKEEITRRVDTAYGGPLVVLIGPASASAAETSAAALGHHHRATLVGGETAGQVLASRNFRLPGGGGVQVAIADWLTPDGHRLEGVGVTPDIPVAQTLEAIRAGRDLPLEAAERALIEGRRP